MYIKQQATTMTPSERVHALGYQAHRSGLARNPTFTRNPHKRQHWLAGYDSSVKHLEIERAHAYQDGFKHGYSNAPYFQTIPAINCVAAYTKGFRFGTVQHKQLQEQQRLTVKKAEQSAVAHCGGRAMGASA